MLKEGEDAVLSRSTSITARREAADRLHNLETPAGGHLDRDLPAPADGANSGPTARRGIPAADGGNTDPTQPTHTRTWCGWCKSCLGPSGANHRQALCHCWDGNLWQDCRIAAAILLGTVLAFIVFVSSAYDKTLDIRNRVEVEALKNMAEDSPTEICPGGDYGPKIIIKWQFQVYDMDNKYVSGGGNNSLKVVFRTPDSNMSQAVCVQQHLSKIDRAASNCSLVANLSDVLDALHQSGAIKYCYTGFDLPDCFGYSKSTTQYATFTPTLPTNNQSMQAFDDSHVGSTTTASQSSCIARLGISKQTFGEKPWNYTFYANTEPNRSTVPRGSKEYMDEWRHMPQAGMLKLQHNYHTDSNVGDQIWYSYQIGADSTCTWCPEESLLACRMFQRLVQKQSDSTVIDNLCTQAGYNMSFQGLGAKDRYRCIHGVHVTGFDRLTSFTTMAKTTNTSSFLGLDNTYDELYAIYTASWGAAQVAVAQALLTLPIWVIVFTVMWRKRDDPAPATASNQPTDQAPPLSPRSDIEMGHTEAAAGPSGVASRVPLQGHGHATGPADGPTLDALSSQKRDQGAQTPT